MAWSHSGSDSVCYHTSTYIHWIAEGTDQVEAKIEKLEDNKVKAQVVAEVKEVDDVVGKTYKTLARQYSFPGFRKGKAPRPVIDNAIGREAVLASATEDLVNALYPRVVEEQKLFPVASPDFGEVGTIEPGKPFTFEVTVAVKPELELTSYDPVEVEVPLAEATPKEIESQIEALTDHYKTYENASAATKLTADRAADINIKATKADGSAVDSLTSESLLYSLGTGLYSEALDKKIEGIKKGETRTFSVDVPEDETAMLMADLAGQTVSFEVTCAVVKKEQAPELTDEWVSETLGFDTVDALKKEIADSLEQQKAQVIPQIKENACAMQLAERVQGEVPASMAEQVEAELLQDFFSQLQRANVSFDSYLLQKGIDNAEFKEDVKRQAQDEAKRELALDAWARNKGIEATDEDITLEFERAGLDDPRATEREWRESGRLYMIREGLIRSKAMADVLETAKVTEVDFAARDEKDAASK